MSGDMVPLAVIASTVHVLAMALWVGGLAALALVALPDRETAASNDVLGRWSRLAVASVTVVVVTGAFQSVRQVKSLDSFVDTDFGRILTLKIVLFAAMAALAVFGSEIVRALSGRDSDMWPDRATEAMHGDDPRDADEGRAVAALGRSVWIEVVLAGAILVATSLLVNAAPPTSSEGGDGAVGVTLKSAKIWVDVTVAPGRQGRNDIHVSTLSPGGAPEAVRDLTVTVALPGRGIAPIDVPLRHLGPGHYLSPGFDMPIAGTWKIVAKPLLSEFEQLTLQASVEIGS